jgi:farnesyl-diphosphate farnesyltransferase
MQWLGLFGQAVAGTADIPRWPVSLLNGISDPNERRLLEAVADLFVWLRKLPEPEAALVREVLETIISGQALDLERFASANRNNPVALENDAALEDYAWRVAGCVGAFWTKLGFLTLGDRFSKSQEAELIALGIAYGKGLQLVNILRDLAGDLATGRCYLPVADPHDSLELLASHARWLGRAGEWVGEGEIYATAIDSRRLRAASVLPALLARKTLEPLRGATWEALQTRIKVSRCGVYQSVVRAFFW